MVRNLFVQLWGDESGAVVAIEYLMLASIVAAGGVTGLAAVRDSMTDECRELGNTVRETRQQFTAPGVKSSGTAKGSAVSDAPVPNDPAEVTSATAPRTYATFSCP